MRVLLIEDDTDLRQAVVRRLEQAGFVAETAADGDVGAYMAETGEFAAIVLDIGLPRVDGLTVLSNLRAAGNQTPVLLLTARDGWRDRVKGLRLGADDYLGKPFQTEELLARIEALIRRAHGLGDPVVSLGALELDLSARELRCAGEPIHLTANEYRALAALAVDRGRVLSKIVLAEQIWLDETDRDLNAVEVTIARLRKKIGAGVIETRRGHGYVIP